jgi:hypothetical protein
VDNNKIRRLGLTGYVIGKEDERVPKMFLMGNITKQDQWENQEQDGRTSSGGTHRRS